jgi:TniQ
VVIEPLIISPLPRLVRPIRDETIDSYLLRVGNANHLHPMELHSMITGEPGSYTPKPSPIPAHRLAQLTGIPARILVLALPELAQVADEPLPLAGRPRPGITTTRPACMRCIRGRTAPPWGAPRVWSLHEDAILCIRHRCLRGQPPYALTTMPETIRANQRHRRLIRRYGRTAVRIAFGDAARITTEHSHALPGFGRRMEILCGPEWSVMRDDLRHLVSTYPETVELTRLFVSPYWRALILTGHLPGTDLTYRDPDYISAIFAEYTSIERFPKYGFLLRRASPEITRFMNEVHRAVSPRFLWYPERASKYDISLATWVHDTLKLDQARQWRGARPIPSETFE